MKTYFCISDIHSGYTPMKRALDEAGYDINNENHIFVSLGDNFDRLNESKEVFDFLSSIPKNQRILIRGNHEDLLEELLEKDRPQGHDYSNGTVKTICSFTGESETDIRFGPIFSTKESKVTADIIWKRAVKEFKQLPVYEFIKDDSNWVNYAEIGDYILVHSFIPTAIIPEYKFMEDWPHYYLDIHIQMEKKDWRENSSKINWEDARWGCPWQLFKAGFFNEELNKGKKLVCGHWHTSDFFMGMDGEEVSIDECPIYNSHGLIGLDACTAHTNRCNVFKIEG